MANIIKQEPRFLFWGIDGNFSYHVLAGLISEGLCPSAVIIPDLPSNPSLKPITLVEPEPSTSSLPLLNPYMHNSIYQTAWGHNIPLFKIRDLTSEYTHQALKDLQPSIAVVACFPKRIPKQVLNLPQYGFLNLHPSILPDLRGPYPLFWTFRLGLVPGISLHVMDEGFDTGNIVFQKNIYFDDGINGTEADFLLAAEGVILLTKTIKMVEKGFLETNQQQGTGSRYSNPKNKDFSIPTSWTAQRAFNFMRGTAEWGHPYTIEGPNFTFKARTAVSYSQESTLTQPYHQKGVNIWINFSPGLVHVSQ